MKYFWLTLKHKWFVFYIGRKMKVPFWRLVFHDWTKFLPCELPHYQRKFFGKADDPIGFLQCWVHHQNYNPHHWEYWIPRTPYQCTPIPMPEWAIREMVADWMGASRAYGGSWPDLKNWPWLKDNLEKIRLHPESKTKLLTILKELGVVLDI
jgi:hypothetical protein